MAHHRQGTDETLPETSGLSLARFVVVRLALVLTVAAGCATDTSASQTTGETDRAEQDEAPGATSDTDLAEGSDAEPTVERSTAGESGERLTAAELQLDTSACPPELPDIGPIRIGVNGGGLTDSRHVEGLQAAVDEADLERDPDDRPIELITAIEKQSDDPRSLFHLDTLLDRGDLHAIVPWGGWPDPTPIAARFKDECVPGLFWMAAPAPDASWVVPGLDDPRAEMAVIAAWLAEEVEAKHVAILPLDWPSEASIGESLAESLRRRSIPEVTISPIPLLGPMPLTVDLGPADAAHPIDAVVVPTAGPQCVEVAADIRARLPDAVVIVRSRCEPYDDTSQMSFDGVMRTRWVGEEPPTDPFEANYLHGLATGRAVVAAIAAAAELEGGLTRANILRSARTLRNVVPDTAPGVLLATNGPDDVFARESAVLDVYELRPPSPLDRGWHQVGPVIEADGTTPMTEIDWTQRSNDEEPLPCVAPDGRLSISTSHWFGEDGRLDPLADVVLSVNHAGLSPSPGALLLATGADGTAIELPMVLGRGGSACAGEVFFDIQPGQIIQINDLRRPVEVVFEIDDSVTTVAVRWPDDFPQEPPFDPVRLVPAK